MMRRKLPKGFPPEKVKTNEATYTIGDLIGSGGNAEVYKCADEDNFKRYAIKFQMRLNKSRPERFENETKLIEKLESHAHLIEYVDKGQHNKYPFIIMELAEDNLMDKFKKQDDFTEEEYLAQFRGLSKALEHLHEHAIHRDIKPENILVSNGKWLLSDYGLCKFDSDTVTNAITKDGEKVGPVFWMSPEANNLNCGIDDAIDKSSDVFQLASIFWMIVNSKHPTGVLKKEDWNGPEKLFEPIFKALHNDKGIRPRNGEEFANQIEEAIIEKRTKNLGSIVWDKLAVGWLGFE